MQVERAKQIFESDDTINVDLNGQAVWIESVDEAADRIAVHFTQNPSEKRIISSSQLQES